MCVIEFCEYLRLKHIKKLSVKYRKLRNLFKISIRTVAYNIENLKSSKWLRIKT